MTRRRRILIAGAQPDRVEPIARALQRHGHETLTACDGQQALEAARGQRPDLVIFDTLSPALPSHEAAAQLRRDPATAAIPILLLTAQSPDAAAADVSAGADDYLARPVCMKVLLAHVTALLRRQAAAEPAAMECAGPLVIDRSQREVTLQGQPINLTATEYKLLAALVAARGRVLSRQGLIDRVMGNLITDRAIDVHITALRKKLGKFAWMVHTVRGVGYGLRTSRTSTAGR